MFDYYFGIYHWRRRGRRIGLGLAVAAIGAAVGGVVATDPAFVVGLAGVAGGLWYAQRPLKQLLVPSPFSPQRWKYAPLVAGIDWDREEAAVDWWVDLGSGTGRALVGMSEAVPEDCLVTAIDPFDSRVILGNGPGLARRNGARAGLTVEPIRGDAARVPLAADSQDVVTACRLLHDLQRETAERTLREARRVLGPDGQLGLLELPETHEPTDDPLGYWERLAADAGFTVTASGRVERRGSAYLYVIASLDTERYAYEPDSPES